MIFNAYKVISSLPENLSPNTLYLVRVGTGFDFYCSDSTGAIAHKINSSTSSQKESLLIYLSPPHSNISPLQNASIITYFPYDLTISELIIAVDTAPTGSDIIVDLNVGGVSFLSTKLSIASGSLNSGLDYVIDNVVLPDNKVLKGSLLSVDIDQSGIESTGTNLILIINGERS